ncbi:hypothetical protein EVAR_50360_1 [Eumeta japonica]|uniref:Uncharacterized protein n=1 Tax=Eumeta variegata TaxID=151549 RepID=A0A4C1Y1D7_EUMVA|nr:hypothetical protein EVAR_50360_1 [Eumeta japonica]
MNKNKRKNKARRGTDAPPVSCLGARTAADRVQRALFQSVLARLFLSVFFYNIQSTSKLVCTVYGLHRLKEDKVFANTNEHIGHSPHADPLIRKHSGYTECGRPIRRMKRTPVCVHSQTASFSVINCDRSVDAGSALKAVHEQFSLLSRETRSSLFIFTLETRRGGRPPPRPESRTDGRKGA